MHVKNESKFIRILNCKCMVLPLFIKNTAISKDATAIAILSCDLTYASKVLYRKVFLMLSDPSIKKYLRLFLIAWIISLYMTCWFLFSNETFLCNLCSNCMMLYVFSSWINWSKSSVLWLIVVIISEGSGIFKKSCNDFSFKCR